MEQTEIVLTPAERLILNSYRDLVCGLEDYLGIGYEIVLHSLESMEHSVIAIANGHYTNRHEGSPITDLALDMLRSIQQEDGKSHISYFSRNRSGEPLRSTTIVIYGENRRAIGLLCINFYLNTPLYKLIGHLTEDAMDEEQIRDEVEQDIHILPSLKNKEIIKRCSSQGIFQIKSAVTSVAKILNISKNTVYLHLKSLE